MCDSRPTMIVPCAGRSSRYPNVRPKWMLTTPTGQPMVVAASLCVKNVGRVVPVILKEHNEQYDAYTGVNRAFNDYGIDAHVCVLPEPTTSQADTVRLAIKRMDITGPILIKDADNSFAYEFREAHAATNFICTSDLTEHELVNARNKSYCVLGDDDLIQAVHEKLIVSTTFSAGGYFFRDASVFAHEAGWLIDEFNGKEVYVSHVIDSLIANGETFVRMPIKELCDWGTLDDWNRYLARFKTYYIDIDGVLFENGGRYFKPYRLLREAIVSNVNVVNGLYESKNMIVLTTSRPESERADTCMQLSRAGVKYHELVMGCLHAGRVLINDFALTNPYPSARAISIPRNAELARYMEGK